MQLTADRWQNCAEDWQTSFIHHNFLLLGYAAWRGYLDSGPGLVASDLVRPDFGSAHRPVNPTELAINFVPAARVGDYLAQQGLAAQVIPDLCSAVWSYSPEQEMLLSLNCGGDMTIQRLQNLAIAPPTCYQQVCDRWSEFTDAAGLLAPDCRHVPVR